MRISFLRYLLILSWISSTGFSKSEFEVNVESFRKKLFSETGLENRSCVLQSRGQNRPKLDEFEIFPLVNKILELTKKNRAKELLSYFHPKMAVKEDQLYYMIEGFSKIYGSPIDLSLFRIWAINTIDGKPEAVECKEDLLSLGPHYGYPFQYGVWAQISGSKELGRLYFSLVPFEGKWLMGAWHSQLWSHAANDPEAMINSALNALKVGKKEIAYTKLDLATKLLNGAGYIMLALRADAIATRDSIFEDGKFLEYLGRQIRKPHRLLYVGTIFSKDGPGLFLRFLVPEKTKAADLTNLCVDLLKETFSNLTTSYRSEDWGTFRCGLVYPNENPTQDGKLGSKHFTPSLFLEKTKKS